MRIGAEHNGGSVAVSPGQTLELVLPERGGTGYRWELEPLPAGVSLVADRVESGVLPGAQGQRVFTLCASLTEDTHVRARLRRSWEPAELTADRFSIRLVR
ncbi:protease inhibitor I42 family protein [Longispora sp. NPDC051575]|uniref:protease inhibitor I42 family protein n=1 Tax=Longispora sp. NPDC051575 TaxID=3154943 RepID=UPI0034480178